jgi:hypothetical protein
MNEKLSIKGVFDIPEKEYTKHIQRVENIVARAKGDPEKEKNLTRNMANTITDIDKAYGRYLVAEELNRPDLGKIFLERFKDLTYTVHDWRKEKIEAFLKEISEEEV